MSDGLRGRFIWYELLTSDPDAAIDFYTRLIGWSSAPFDVSGQEYTMWMKGEVPVGGVMQLPEEAVAGGAPPHWLAYLGTSDVDATSEQAQQLGASVLVPPTTIPEAGRFSVLQDPQGAVIAVYTPPELPPMDEEPTPGCFSWHELATTDHEAAFDFYSKLFGWEKQEAIDMGEAGIYQMYGAGGPPLGGMFNRTAEMPVSAWLYYIMVQDIETAAARVRELGGLVVNGPMEVPGGSRIAQCSDPQGAMFAIHSVARAG
ncbi:MAG: VOC family protein [Gemmatimonadales bacterium]|jgi:predicted enzyme related to lactoylglutathione lyase